MNTKAFLFGIARWAAALAAVALLIFRFGGDTLSNADPEAVETAVVAQLDMTDMLRADNQMVKRLYGLDPSAYEGCILYYPTTNMMAEELLIVKLADMDQREAVLAAVQQRLDTQKNTFEGYGVEQFALLSSHCVIEARGNFVLFVVSANDAAARKAFLGAL